MGSMYLVPVMVAVKSSAAIALVQQPLGTALAPDKHARARAQRAAVAAGQGKGHSGWASVKIGMGVRLAVTASQ